MGPGPGILGAFGAQGREAEPLPAKGNVLRLILPSALGASERGHEPQETQHANLLLLLACFLGRGAHCFPMQLIFSLGTCLRQGLQNQLSQLLVLTVKAQRCQGIYLSPTWNSVMEAGLAPGGLKPDNTPSTSSLESLGRGRDLCWWRGQGGLLRGGGI